MILWNAFYEYFIHKGGNPKYITLGILVGLFVFQKFGVWEWCRVRLSHIPVKRWMLLILVLGFLLRLAWILWSPYRPPAAGTEDYIMIRHGQELADGRGYVTTEGAPSADRPVGYALLLSVIFKFFGVDLGIVALVNILCSLVSVWIVYRLGTQIKNEFVGLGAALLLAIDPTSIFASPIVLEEHVFIPMWLMGVSLLIADYQKADWKKVVLSGLLFGVAAHFRTFSFAMGLVAFFMWAFIKRNLGQAVLRLLVIQALIIAIAMPWAIRNKQKLGEPILYTTWIGAALYFSNNPVSDVRYPINPSLEQGGDPAFSKARTEIERNRAGKSAALKWIKNNPGIFLQKAIGRTIFMLGFTREGWTLTDNFNTLKKDRIRPPDKLIKVLNRADNDYYAVVFLLALFGVIVFFFPGERHKRKPGIGFILLTLMYYLSIIALTMGQRKYRFVIEPFFCILAAYGVSFFIKPAAPARLENLPEQTHG